MRSPVAPSGAWINGRQACQTAGVVQSVLQRLALIGVIRYKLEPGIPPNYHRGDCIKYAASPKPPPAKRNRKPKPSGSAPADLNGQTHPDVTSRSQREKKPRRMVPSEVQDETLKGGSRHA